MMKVTQQESDEILEILQVLRPVIIGAFPNTTEYGRFTDHLLTALFNWKVQKANNPHMNSSEDK